MKGCEECEEEDCPRGITHSGVLMFLKPKSQAAPIVLLIISGLWMALLVIPLLYSLVFPHPYLREAIQAFEGRPVSRPELAKLGGEINESFGKLEHAIQLGAYYHGSAEYKAEQLHKTKDVEYTYLVKFKKRPHFSIMAIEVTETDDSPPNLSSWVGSIGGMVQAYLPPVLLLAFSVFWFRRSRTRSRGQHYRSDPVADSSRVPPVSPSSN
ncbi:MAG: hypothetical protein JSS69_04295 [Acidobacteria bacterium]|nr:hypothetical protein [Acidobacteriota bacterium]MBS1865116.1 hypothetical protein [Acidobacteriota bacterium]